MNVTVYSVDDSVVKERCSNGRGARSFQNVLDNVGLFVRQRRCVALIQHISLNGRDSVDISNKFI